MTSIVCASVHVRTYTHVRKRRDGGKRCEGRKERGEAREFACAPARETGWNLKMKKKGESGKGRGKGDEIFVCSVYLCHMYILKEDGGGKRGIR